MLKLKYQLYLLRIITMEERQMGILKKFQKELLEKKGTYSKGYYYVTDDESGRVLLLKPKNSEKHVYFIPDFEKIKTTDVSKAVYALLKSDNRRVLHLKTKTGQTDIYFDDTLIDIFKKLTKIDEKSLKQ